MTESPRWLARFVIYRDLGPSRTFLDTYQRDGGAAPALPLPWYDHADQYHWRDRAQAWDKEQRDQARAQAREAIDRERRDRVTLLKAARAKMVAAFTEIDARSEDFGPIVAQISTLTSQLRAESEE